MGNKSEFIHNIELEQLVIGSILTYSEVYEDVKERLSLDIFTDLDCRRTYEIIEQFVREGKSPTIADVGYALIQGGGNIANIMLNTSSSIELVSQHIDTLNDLRIRREILSLSYKAINIVHDPLADTDDVQRLIKNLEEVLNGKTDEVEVFGDSVTKLANDVAVLKEGVKVQGIMTGLRIFDRHFGFHDGDMIILAGETSQGKTTLATTIVKNMAVNGVPIAFYSMEMSAKQLTARIISGDVQVKSSDLLYSKLTDEQYNRFYDTSSRMKSLPIYFDESSKTSFVGICRSIRRMVKRFGIKVVFIDYLQILANGGRLDSREQIIGDMARDLKRLAVELDICIVALSQLARLSQKVQDRQPTINRLRGSGQIEEAADIVVLIHRQDLKSDRATIYIAKGRNIGLDKCDVKFNAGFSYFADFEQNDPQAPFKDKDEDLPF